MPHLRACFPHGEDAAEADAAMDEPGESIPWEQVKAELDL